MSIARRTFLKSATRTALAAGLALGSAHLIFGQDRRNESSLEPAEPIRRLIKTDPDGYFPVPFEAQESDLFYFKSSTFTPYVGDIFQIPNALGQMITLRLVSVTDYRVNKGTKLGTRKTRQPESFALTFSAVDQLPPFTSIHRMSHPALGTFDLFLTSRRSRSGDYSYDAIINHIQ